MSESGELRDCQTVWFQSLPFFFSSYKTQQISCDYIALSPLKLNLCGNLWAADWNIPIPRQRWKLSLTKKMTPRPWSSATKWFSPAEEHGGRLIFCTSIIMFQRDLFFLASLEGHLRMRRAVSSWPEGLPLLDSRRQWKIDCISVWRRWRPIDQWRTSGTYRTFFPFRPTHPRGSSDTPHKINQARLDVSERQ